MLPIPWFIHRGFHLPAWAKGKETLVFLHPIPGDGREVDDLLEQAISRGCQVVCLSVKGAAKLVPYWEPPVDATVGWYFARLYATLERAGFLPPLMGDLEETMQAMQRSLAAIQPQVLVVRNPAKRLAGQFFDRRVILFAAGFLAPVARLWKMCINTFARAGADFEMIPEADYNSLTGLDRPEAGVKDLMAVFLRASTLHPKNLQALDLTRQFCLQMGINTDFVEARGESRLAQLWTSVIFADMTAYYLAMAYGLNPAQDDLLEGFQAEMAS
jgi:glucose/mannose-6-phosphate isomerase